MSVLRVALVAIFLCAGVALAEWAGYSYSRAAGDLSLFTLPIVACIVSWLLGALSSRLAIAFVAVVLGGLLAYVNYAYLCWLRVVLLGEIDTALFQYFGAYYAFGINVTAIVSGVVAFAGAWVSKRKQKRGQAGTPAETAARAGD